MVVEQTLGSDVITIAVAVDGVFGVERVSDKKSQRKEEKYEVFIDDVKFDAHARIVLQPLAEQNGSVPAYVVHLVGRQSYYLVSTTSAFNFSTIESIATAGSIPY